MFQEFQELKMSEQFKRNTAYKLRIGEILIGTPLINGDRFSFLELGNRKIVRVNLVGNIVDKYEGAGNSENEGKKYIFFTLDDGSGQIKLKSFGEDYNNFRNIFQGQTVVVIGNLRYWNNETYVVPEIIKEVDVRYLLLRKLETEKEKSLNSGHVVKGQIMAVRDKILEMIKNSEDNGGVDSADIFAGFPEISSSLIQQEIQRLLEEGIIFEPRPGRIRWLG